MSQQGHRLYWGKDVQEDITKVLGEEDGKEMVEQLDLERRFGMWGDVEFLALPSIFVSFLILAGLRMTQMLCKD